MPEPSNFTFGHAELAEILIKQTGVHEGHWGVYIEFGLMGGNFPTAPDSKTFAPAAITLINKIGIQRFEIPSNLTVDAGQVNPASGSTHRKRPKAT